MKIEGALFSVGASGTFGKVLTFSIRSGKQFCRFQRKQKDILTPKREFQRKKYIEACNLCKIWGFGVAEFGYSHLGVAKETYLELSRQGGLSWFNLCLQDFLRSL
jgi:hypothetical protein